MHDHFSQLPEALEFTDARDLADLKNFVSRAKTVQDSGIRLQASGTVLRASVCVLRPGLLGESTPVVLGLRTMALASEAQVDVTVALGAVLDRVARDDSSGTLPLPPTHVHESWSGVGVPKGPWEPVATLSPASLQAAAEAGITRVAGIVPTSPGALIVNNARATVWGEGVDLVAELGAQPVSDVVPLLPRGAAFAAHMLGFLPPVSHPAHDAGVQLFRHGIWLRLSTPLGHVLVRQAAGL